MSQGKSGETLKIMRVCQLIVTNLPQTLRIFEKSRMLSTKLRIFLLVLIFSSHFFSEKIHSDVPFLPNTVIQAPMFPEASQYGNILDSLGNVHQYTGLLSISDTEVKLPSQGLLGINVVRTFRSPDRDIGKSDDVISNYLRFLYSAYDTNMVTNIPIGIQQIKENFEVQSKNDFLDNESKPLGANWDLSVNGFNKIYLWEIFDNTRDTSAGSTDGVRYFWRYQARVLMPESSLNFEINHSNYSPAQPDRFNFNKNSELGAVETKDNEWEHTGFNANGILEKDVVQRKRYKLLYTSGSYSLIQEGGIKYIFSTFQNVVNDKIYSYKGIYTNQRRVNKKIAYLSRIEDKYGNYIRLDYDSGFQLTNIIDRKWVDNPGERKVILNYSGNKVSSIAYPNDLGSYNFLQYSYQGENLQTKYNELNQGTTYIYNGLGQISDINTPYSTSVHYDYQNETLWLAGYPVTSTLPSFPDDPIKNFLQPEPKSVVSVKQIFQDGQKAREWSFIKITFFNWTNPVGDFDPNKKNFLLDSSYFSIFQNTTFGARINQFIYDQRGLVSNQIDSMGFVNSFEYKRGSKYYLEPTLAIQSNYILSPQLITKKSETFYDDSGFPTNSLVYKSGGDANYFTRSESKWLVNQIGDFFFQLPQESGQYTYGSSIRMRGSKADYNAFNNIQTIYQWNQDQSTYDIRERAVYDSTFPWMVTKTYGAMNDEDSSVTYGYDSTYHLFVTAVSNSVYPTLYERYPESGRILRVTDPNGNQSEAIYDVLGRLVEAHLPQAGFLNTTLYSDSERKVTSTKKRIDTLSPLTETETSFNSFNQSTRSISREFRLGTTTTNLTTYYDDGNIQLQRQFPDTTSETFVRYEAYDGYNRPGQVLRNNGIFDKFTYTYDPVNNFQITAVERNNPSAYNQNLLTKTYSDFLGRKLEETSELIGDSSRVIRVAYQYDSLSQLLQVTQNPHLPNPVVYTYKYDSLGRKTNQTQPDGAVYGTTYEADDQVRTSTSPNGVQSNFFESKLRRLIKTTFPQSPALLYTYDDTTGGNKGIGKQTRIEKEGEISTELTFGAADRLVAEKKSFDGFTFTLGFSYDPAGVLDTVVYPDGKLFFYQNTYDGKLLSGTVGGTTFCNYLYDGFGRVANHYQNNQQIRTDYGYIKENLQSLDTHLLVGGVPKDRLFQFIYTYDRGFLIRAKDIYGRDTKYLYDPLTEALTNALYVSDNINLAYQYDLFQNRTFSKDAFRSVSYSYLPGKNRLDKITFDNPLNQTLYSYDASGNTTSYNDTFANRTNKQTSIGWDDQNQLSTFNQNFFSANLKLPTNSLSFSAFYDHSGIRYKKIVNGKTNYFITDSSGKIYEEINEFLETSKTYLYGVGNLGFISHKNFKESTNYFFKDRLGTVIRIFNQNNKLVASTEIDPFGNIIYEKKEIENSIIFTGKERDFELGLDYFGSRYFDPLTARWLSVDKKDMSGNQYLYCKNNPMKFLDPDGNDWIEAFEYNPWDPKGGIAFRFGARGPILEKTLTGVRFNIQNLIPEFFNNWVTRGANNPNPNVGQDVAPISGIYKYRVENDPMLGHNAPLLEGGGNIFTTGPNRNHQFNFLGKKWDAFSEDEVFLHEMTLGSTRLGKTSGGFGVGNGSAGCNGACDGNRFLAPYLNKPGMTGYYSLSRWSDVFEVPYNVGKSIINNYFPKTFSPPSTPSTSSSTLEEDIGY